MSTQFIDMSSKIIIPALICTLVACDAQDQRGDISPDHATAEEMTATPQSEINHNIQPSPSHPEVNTTDQTNMTPSNQNVNPHGMMCHGVLNSDQSCAQDQNSQECAQCQNQAALQCSESACVAETQALAQCASERGCMINGQVDEACLTQRCGGEYSVLTNYTTCLSMCPQVFSCYMPSECNRCGLELFEGKVIYYGGCFEGTTTQDDCIGRMLYLKPNGEYLETYQTTSNGEQTLKSSSGYWHTDCRGLYLEECGGQMGTQTYRYLITEDRLLLSDTPNLGYTHYHIWSNTPDNFILDESDLSPQCPR